MADRRLIAEGILAKPLVVQPRRFGGDNVVLGKGEILFPG
jgi:formylmethanofuran dehydrogenase subunit C